MRRTGLSVVLLACVLTGALPAHDTWVETNAPVIRPGDLVHVDLKLGNHGNDHRDFKLASRITLDRCTLEVRSPSGDVQDLKSRVVDTGFGPKEGYWTARYVTAEPGLHVVAHTLDTLHGTTRAIKSGKTFFMAAGDWQAAGQNAGRCDQPLGHPIEIVPLTNPVTEAGPGKAVRVRIQFDGQPLAGARVSFIPRGVKLAEGFDPAFERTTDASGEAEYTPQEGNLLLVVVHHARDDQRGEGYDKTHYSATLTIQVPQIPIR